MIKKNKLNSVNRIDNNINNTPKCRNVTPRENVFDLKNIELIMIDLQNITNQDQKIVNENNLLTPDKLEFIDRVNVNHNNYILGKYSGNKKFNFKDLQNVDMSKKLNVSDKNSLLINNNDCSNDQSCIIKKSDFNLHSV